MSDPRQPKWQIAQTLARAGFEPGRDFSAARGRLLCTRQTQTYLRESAPPGIARLAHNLTQLDLDDPVEAFEAQVGCSGALSALVARVRDTASTLSDAQAGAYTQLLGEALEARHPYLFSSAIVGELVLSERADALLERLYQGQSFAVSVPERDRLLARMCDDVLQALDARCPRHYQRRRDGYPQLTRSGYQLLARALGSPDPQVPLEALLGQLGLWGDADGRPPSEGPNAASPA